MKKKTRIQILQEYKYKEEEDAMGAKRLSL